MGNGKSQPENLQGLEEKPALNNFFYAIRVASFGSHPERKVTIFEGIKDNKSKHSAVDRFSKNVMVHRHPNVLKYVASWSEGEKFCLATEEVEPLQRVISKQTPLQVCIGLHSILKAIQFLHEKACSSHNNICRSSVYVTPEGQWKLGGLEYLCRYNDLNLQFLSETRQGRYDRAFSPGEETKLPQPLCAIDLFAFGVLIEEVFSHTKLVSDNVPGATEFLHVATAQLQSSVSGERPSFDLLLKHSFFNHQFITIHNFLTELPLKTDVDKQLFFRELTIKLSEFGEEVVASQLGILLLSRIVLLDATAQKFLLPQILNPKTGDDSQNLFSEKSYRKHIIPKLMSIFCVRDIQVRIILLTYFKSFCTMFTKSQLHSHILPELLVGIKDTNDNLVTATLRALADLVPILGAAAVIGGKRGRHFSDGRPKIHPSKGIRKTKSPRSGDIDTPAEEGKDMFLCERPSPDGGEAPSSQTLSEDEVEQWDSWDTPVANVQSEPVLQTEEQNDISSTSNPLEDSEPTLPIEPKKRGMTPLEEEVDFFRDMEPVISKTQIVQITEEKFKNKKQESNFDNLNNLSFEVADEDCSGEGWGDGLEWADISAPSDAESNESAKLSQ